MGVKPFSTEESIDAAMNFIAQVSKFMPCQRDLTQAAGRVASIGNIEVAAALLTVVTLAGVILNGGQIIVREPTDKSQPCSAVKADGRHV